MATETCSGCGRLTNSACSDYWEKNHKPTKCKAAFVDGRWVPGCDYGSEQLDEEMYGGMFKPAGDSFLDRLKATGGVNLTGGLTTEEAIDEVRGGEGGEE